MKTFYGSVILSCAGLLAAPLAAQQTGAGTAQTGTAGSADSRVLQEPMNPPSVQADPTQNNASAGAAEGVVTAPQAQVFNGRLLQARAVNLGPREGSHVLAQLLADNGQTITVDMGPLAGIRNIRMRRGTQVNVRGQMSSLNDSPVFVADAIRDARGGVLMLDRGQRIWRASTLDEAGWVDTFDDGGWAGRRLTPQEQAIESQRESALRQQQPFGSPQLQQPFGSRQQGPLSGLDQQRGTTGMTTDPGVQQPGNINDASGGSPRRFDDASGAAPRTFDDASGLRQPADAGQRSQDTGRIGLQPGVNPGQTGRQPGAGTTGLQPGTNTNRSNGGMSGSGGAGGSSGTGSGTAGGAGSQ